MLPASDLSEILVNLSALNLQPTTAAQILAAVLAPLLRSSDPQVPDLPQRRAGRPRGRLRRSSQRGRKPRRRRAAAAAAAAAEPTNGPRQRAARALAASPGASANAIAKIAGVNRGTVVNARDELAAQARKRPAEPSERRERAQRFLREQLGRGPKPVSDIEAAAAKAHIDEQALGGKIQKFPVKLGFRAASTRRPELMDRVPPVACCV